MEKRYKDLFLCELSSIKVIKQSKWYELKLNNLKCFQTHDRYGQAMKIAKTSPGRFVIWFGKNLISPLQKMNAGPARKL